MAMKRAPNSRLPDRVPRIRAVFQLADDVARSNSLHWVMRTSLLKTLAHKHKEEYVDAYIEAAGLEDQKNDPLFRSAIGRTKKLSDRSMSRHAALRMIQRRGKGAGILTAIRRHSFRATGVTNYHEHGGTPEKAQPMAAHASPKTTKIYDRTQDATTLDEVERIAI